MIDDGYSYLKEYDLIDKIMDLLENKKTAPIAKKGLELNNVYIKKDLIKLLTHIYKEHDYSKLYLFDAQNMMDIMRILDQVENLKDYSCLGLLDFNTGLIKMYKWDCPLRPDYYELLSLYKNITDNIK